MAGEEGEGEVRWWGGESAQFGGVILVAVVEGEGRRRLIRDGVRCGCVPSVVVGGDCSMLTTTEMASRRDGM